MLKVYGPYVNKENRQFVVLYNTETQAKKSLAYAKYLMQEHLGRELSKEEEVDHINRDKNDNRIENLQILDQTSHRQKDARRIKPIEVVCISCGQILIRQASQLNANARRGKAGPFCRVCAGRYGTDLQNNKITKLPAQPSAKSEYYYED